MYIDINIGAAGTTMFNADGSRAAAGWSLFASCAGIFFHSALLAPFKLDVDMDKHYIKLLVAVRSQTHTYKQRHYT